jgi:NAD+--asparagine ADP-ribosyltransferase
MNSKELVLKEMFGTNNNHAGYNSICNNLIEKGECISTIYASFDFKKGEIHNFVKQEPYSEGVDLIKFSIDKEYIYSSKLFEEYKNYLINKKQQELEKLYITIGKMDKLNEIHEILAKLLKDKKDKEQILRSIY